MMDILSAKNSKWSPISFILTQIIGVALFLSWNIEGMTRSFWDKLDLQVFTFLNGTLSNSGNLWTTIWAIANNRLADLIPGIIMIAICYFYMSENKNKYFKQKLSLCIVLLAFTVVSTWICKRVCPDKNPSPCHSQNIDRGRDLDFEPVRLSKLYPKIKPKDRALDSFPGDHSIILFSLVVAMFLYGRRRYFITSFAVCAIFALPRLFSGAHWLSDIIVGGLFIIILSSGWLYATPLVGILINFVEKKIISKIFKLKIIKKFIKIED